jgi:hypothetical protein
MLCACTDLPWGVGGAEVTPVTRGALVRVLGEDELLLGARRLSTELTTRIGHALELRELTVPIGPGYDVALGPVSATLGPLTLKVTDDASLELTVELAIAPQEVTGLPAACDAQLTLAAGALLLDFDLSNDKVGRPLPIPRGTPRWQGPPPELAISGCALAGLQINDLGPRLVTAAWSMLQEPLIQGLPSALGLDLALSSSSVVGLDALGAGILRASLRVAQTPPARLDPGLAVVFDLGVDAEAHPCADFGIPTEVSTDPEEPPPLPSMAGTSLSIRAAERLLRLTWVAGSVCGASAWRNIPDPLREIPLDELAMAGGSELLGLDAAATASATFWPRELPRLLPDELFPDTLRLEVARLEADVTVVLDGARWRLFTLELDLTIRGQLATDSDGFVHFDPIDVEPTLRASSRGLIAVPPDGPARVLEPIVRALLESRPLLRLPPSITPSNTAVWRVGPDHLTLTDPR